MASKLFGRKLRMVDLFAGCGGLSLGLEQAGFEPAYVSELNRDALQTYLVNRSHLKLREKELCTNDIRGISRSRKGKERLLGLLRNHFKLKSKDVDLVAGGPPCQGFSGIGHRRNYGVEKELLPSNHLFREMITIVDLLRPKCFLFENVRGLLTAKWTRTGRPEEVFRDVLGRFRSIRGYHVDWALLHAKHYGVPQNRPRVLIVGFRKDVSPLGSWRPMDASFQLAIENGFLPEAKDQPEPPSISDLLSDLMDSNWPRVEETTCYPNDYCNEIQKKLRVNPVGGFFEKGDPIKEQQYSKHSPEVIMKFRNMIRSGNRQVPPGFTSKKFSQRVLPSVWGPNGPTITVTSLPDDYVHFNQPRILTVREWARLQLFPDWYQFMGRRTTGGLRRAGNPREGLHEREVPKYTQIGNAVPVGLAKAIGVHLAKIIRKG